MSRSERLLSLLQLLRRHRHPVGGSVVADELGISLRTLYRDISTLRSQGAGIDGAPGLGYVLKPGFVLPPLIFSADEVDALVLGSRWVLKRGDQRLAAAARNALAKITAVLPQELAREMESSALLIGPAQPLAVTDLEITIREAIRLEHKLELTYQDAGNENSRRTIWPFALGYFDSSRVMVGWCEMRQAIRHFRTDRVVSLSVPGCRYPRRRQALIKEWREQEGIPEP